MDDAMKSCFMKMTLLAGLLLTVPGATAHAQIQTLVTSTNNINSAVLTVSSNYLATLKYVSADWGATIQLNLQGVNFSIDPTTANINNLTFVGPATVQLQGNIYGPAFVTFDVEPGPYPPGKTATVGPNSGNMRVTLQMSTDLVNWAPAVNGMIYTNSPDPRFFRIQMVPSP